MKLPDKPIDPATGIWPIALWGYECARGFASSSRFARPGEQVIPRTNRKSTRKWREAMKDEERNDEQTT